MVSVGIHHCHDLQQTVEMNRYVYTKSLHLLLATFCDTSIHTCNKVEPNQRMGVLLLTLVMLTSAPQAINICSSSVQPHATAAKTQLSPFYVQ